MTTEDAYSTIKMGLDQLEDMQGHRQLRTDAYAALNELVKQIGRLQLQLQDAD